jgi:hypothetical protein
MNPPRKRPVGITLLALLFLWIGCFGSIALPIVIASGGATQTWDFLASPHIHSAKLLAIASYLFAFSWLALYVAYAFIGFGLWKLRDWARRAVIGISLFGLALGIVAEPVFVRPVVLLIPLLVGLLPFAWLFWYLRRPAIVVAFGGVPKVISGPSPKPSNRYRWRITFAIVASFALFVGTLMVAVESMMRSSDAYKMALVTAEKSPCVASKVGVPFKVGWNTSGSIQSSAVSGSADLRIPLHGKNGRADLNLVAKKADGSWTITSLALASHDIESQITPGLPETCN